MPEISLRVIGLIAHAEEGEAENFAKGEKSTGVSVMDLEEMDVLLGQLLITSSLECLKMDIPKRISSARWLNTAEKHL